jgi:acetyl esterase/lipase
MGPAPDAANYSGPNVHKNAPPQSILSKPYFDGPGLGGEVDNPYGGSNGAVNPGAQIMARGRQVPDNPGLSEIVLNNTGSGWLEKFLLFVPTIPIGQRAPLLVVFHRFGVSHWDAYYNTTFFDEARARGWFVIAPLGASQKSFGSLEAQINVNAAISYVTAAFNIDTNRVYGVGFSMGGGAASTYAARHVDPSGVMFAAVLNDTGSVSLSNTWALEYDDDDADDNIPHQGDHLEVPDILEYWYGGPPATRAFYYQRCSMLDIDPIDGSIGVGTDMSRNLSHVPVRDWMANNDPVQYLRNQTTTFDAHINSQNLNNTLTVVNGTVHNWSTLDDHAVCDWLSQFSLQIPRSANTLADQDGTYFWFNVSQAAAGSFTPFSWVLDSANNRITIYNTANLARLTLDATDAGLQYSGALKINMDTSDGTGDQVLLQNVTSPPLSVTRDGVAASGLYEPSSNTFLINETDSAVHMWRLNF